jgi:hypothetical protein
MATVVMPEIHNNGISTLDGAITDSATTINVTSASALGLSDGATDLYLTIIDRSTWRKNPETTPEVLEIVNVTNVSTNALTVTRGADGTSGIAFDDNDIIELRSNAAQLQRVYDAITDGTDTLDVAGVTGDFNIGGFLNVGPAVELTISAGVVTATQTYHTIDTEADAATDDLDTINGGTDGDILILGTADSSRDTTVKDATGNIQLDSATDFTLSHANDRLVLMYKTVAQDAWCELSRSNNG